MYLLYNNNINMMRTKFEWKTDIHYNYYKFFVCYTIEIFAQITDILRVYIKTTKHKN